MMMKLMMKINEEEISWERKPEKVSMEVLLLKKMT
jgi:hypothetical protein